MLWMSIGLAGVTAIVCAVIVFAVGVILTEAAAFLLLGLTRSRFQRACGHMRRFAR